MGYSRADLKVELFSSDKPHVLDPYCDKGRSCCYKLYPRFSELGKALTRSP